MPGPEEEGQLGPAARVRSLEARVRELEEAAAEHERIREALQLSEQRFRLAFQTSPDAICITRIADGMMVDVNEGFARSMGFSREEAVGRTTLELGLWVDPTTRAIMADTVRRGGMIENLEARFRRKDGRTLWGLFSARLIQLEGEPHLLSVARDVDELRQSQAALRRSEAKFKALFEHASDAITLRDMQMRFVDVNPAACAAAGRSRDELLATPPLELVPPDERAHVEATFRRAVAGEHPVIEVSIRRTDGTVVPHESSLQRIEVDGEPMILAVARDISARKRLERQLVEAQKLEAIARLASGIAHDFNNLLTVIRGCASIVAERVAHTPEAEEVEQIQHAADRAADLTRQLLAFARRQLLVPEDVSLNALIENLERMLRRLLPESIEIVTELSADPATVRADPGQLEQVLANLAVNARDAMESGGRLIVRTRNVTRPRPDGGGALPFVCLGVSDTGVGIEPAALDHLFEPFFTTKDKDKGTGLGLSTVHGIVAQSGGFVEVESAPGQGSTFRVWLPASVGEPAAERPELPGVGRYDGTERVLVAEDEGSVRTLVCTTLRRRGYDVVEARDGEEAVRLAASGIEPCAALVTDIVMPRRSGPDVAQAMRTLWPGLRVVFMSGYADESVVSSLPTGPGFAFLQKAFRPNELLRTLRGVLDEGVGRAGEAHAPRPPPPRG